MAKLKLIDTKDKFLLEIDGTEIPYVTSYQITRTVGDVVLLKLALSVANVEKVEIVSDKITEESRRDDMAREKPLFRDNLDRLDVAFPDKEVLQYRDIAKYLGKSCVTVKRHFQKDYNKKLGGISKAVLASILS